MFLLKGHETGKTIRALAFSPDGATLASSGGDEVVCLWDLTNAGVPARLPGGPWALAFFPDGQRLAGVGHNSLTVHGPHGEVVKRLRLPLTYFAGLALAPGGDRVVVASVRPYVIDTTTWGVRSLLPYHDAGTSTAAYAPDGKTFATGHAIDHRNRRRLDRVIFLWDPARERVRDEVRGHSQGPDALTFAPDSRRLAGACGPSMHVWDVATGEQLVHVKPGSLHFKDLAFSPDGRFLLAASNDKTVRMWDTASWRETEGYNWNIGRVTAVAFSPDGMRAAAGSKNGKVVVWDVDP